MRDNLSQSQRKLVQRVHILLNGDLGATPNLFFAERRAATSWLEHVPVGLYMGIAYAVLFYALPALLLQDSFSKRLLWLSVWASFYIAWAVSIARLTSRQVFALINDRVAPVFSDETSQRIVEELDKRFAERRLTVVATVVALLGTAAAGIAASWDVPCAPGQVLWWSVGWFAIFFTAARATYTGRFYDLFAEHLKDDDGYLYALDPARSALVTALNAIGKSMLIFWAGIAVSITTFLLFVRIGYAAEIANGPLCGLYDVPSGSPAASWSWLWSLSARSYFASIVVPTTMIFSIPFGTYVFLRSDGAVREAVDDSLHKTLRGAELEIAGLRATGTALDEKEQSRLDQLVSLHERLATTGAYRSVLLSSLSLLLPLIGPALAILQFLFAR